MCHLGLLHWEQKCENIEWVQQRSPYVSDSNTTQYFIGIC